ncbi:MAG: hypothetical protein QM758_00015 [Armatimonas sp.]
MPLTPSAERRRRRKKWDPILNFLGIIKLLLLLPFGIIFASVSFDKEDKAKQTHCDVCGALLGVGAIEKSDAEQRKRVEHAMTICAYPRMNRLCDAICVECDTRYRYHKAARYFERVEFLTEPSSL